MRVRIEPGTASGSVRAPVSKSFVHRAMICGALGGRTDCVTNPGSCEDILATKDCIEALSRQNGSGECILNCRESASTMRFIIPAALALCGKITVRGSARLLERGIGLYEELFREKNIAVSKSEGEIRIAGTLHGGEYTLRGDVSSQYISGLLMALPILEGSSAVTVLRPVESRSYIDMTVQTMEDFRVRVFEGCEGVFCVPGGQHYKAVDYRAEGDWSGAAFLYALNAAGGCVSVDGLNPRSLQGDRACLELFEKIRRGETADVSQCPDLGPVLMSVCALCGGGKITGTRRLRLKESDRVSVMAAELSKFGISTVTEENSVVILPSVLQRPVQPLCSHNDHRVVMALSVLAAQTGAEAEGCEAVAKSFPGFFDALTELGIECIRN